MDSLTSTGILDANDPAGRFVLDFKEGTLPEGVTERCAVVSSALETEQRSLSLIALLWRAVCGPLFESDNAQEYSGAERQTIRDTLAAIQEKANAWRLGIFEDYLDPYLIRGRYTPGFCLTKAASPSPGTEEQYALLKDLNEERWGKGSNLDSREAAEAYFLEHRYADQMDLVFTFSDTGNLIRHTAGEETLISAYVDGSYTGQHTIGIFDVIATIEDVKLSFRIEGSLKLELSPDVGEEALLNDEIGEGYLDRTVIVNLKAGGEYTYVELLQEIYNWQRNTLSSKACDWLLGRSYPMWNRDVTVIAAVYHNAALLWPAFREMIDTGLTLRLENHSFVETPLSEEDLGRAVLKDIDFWMF